MARHRRYRKQRKKAALQVAFGAPAIPRHAVKTVSSRPHIWGVDPASYSLGMSLGMSLGNLLGVTAMIFVPFALKRKWDSWRNSGSSIQK